jgi:hypothetical protein
MIFTGTTAIADAPAGKCPAEVLCPKFRKLTESCAKKKAGACDAFVDAYAKLASRYDCKRSFDTEPVPAAWLCDEMSKGLYPTLMERAAETLSKLKTKKGRSFFASPEFRSTLDGDIAEQYLTKSEAAAKKAKRP